MPTSTCVCAEERPCVLPLEPTTARWARQDASEGVRKTLFCGLDVYFQPGARIEERGDGGRIPKGADGADVASMPKGGYYLDFIRPTTEDRRIDPDAFRPCDTVSDEELNAFADCGRFFHENTDRALPGRGASTSLVGLSSLLSDNVTKGSLDEWLCVLMTEKETAHDMMGRYVDAAIERIEPYHQAVGNYCLAWGVASDDAGTQKGEVWSPDLFGEMVKPRCKRLCDRARTRANWRTHLRSCGSIYQYVPEWIDAGIDTLNPVRISAANTQPERLMKESGGRIVFWGGGRDTQRVPPFGSPEGVRAHLRRDIEVFSSRPGGLVFTQFHNIQQDVPVENVEAVFEAARESRASGPGDAQCPPMF